MRACEARRRGQRRKRTAELEGMGHVVVALAGAAATICCLPFFHYFGLALLRVTREAMLRVRSTPKASSKGRK